MKDRFVCTNQYRTTVHLYLFLYLHLYVQCNPVAVTVVKRYGVPHPYPLPSLCRSSHQEFSWADYGIPISVEFL